MRIRIGACFTEEPILCGLCSKEVLSRTAAHALCCASAEATRGHYGARDKIFDLVLLGDPNADKEVTELIPSAPTLRPADIFTEAAIPGCRAALDIGICSPDASGAGADCVETMHRKKLETYGEYFEELAAQGVRYVPFVLSCYGRLHPEATTTLERLALQAARRQGVGNHRALLRRTSAALGVAVQRRAVAMARACLPKLTMEALQILFGEPGAAEDFSQHDAGG